MLYDYIAVGESSLGNIVAILVIHIKHPSGIKIRLIRSPQCSNINVLL